MTPIALRPLDLASDVELVHGWMQEPHVEPWWELAGPLERVRDYLRSRVALTHLECWIASEDGRPFAYVECATYEDERRIAVELATRDIAAEVAAALAALLDALTAERREDNAA